ncbi:MAG: hypothetical protein KDI64_05015, partial [Candidatus Accumulibacter sp.]|nr:hypothetical protein [Accumulibacter sp.]
LENQRRPGKTRSGFLFIAILLEKRPREAPICGARRLRERRSLASRRIRRNRQIRATDRGRVSGNRQGYACKHLNIAETTSGANRLAASFQQLVQPTANDGRVDGREFSDFAPHQSMIECEEFESAHGRRR